MRDLLVGYRYETGTIYTEQNYSRAGRGMLRVAFIPETSIVRCGRIETRVKDSPGWLSPGGGNGGRVRVELFEV